MATVGDRLTAPEAGWKRFDDTNTSLKYTGFQTSADANCYNGSLMYTTSNTDHLDFTFYGTKIRILTMIRASFRANNNHCTIDGALYIFSELGAADQYQTIVFENLNLPLGWHTVTIQGVSLTSSVTLSVDAIDIDDIGVLLKPGYSVKYLVQDGTDIKKWVTIPPDSGLMANYVASKANGTSPGSGSLATWNDLSQSNANVTLTGFAFDGTDGWVGSGISTDPYALHFKNAGTEYFDIPLSTNASFTFGFWANFATFNGVAVMASSVLYVSMTATGVVEVLWADSTKSQISPALSLDTWYYIVIDMFAKQIYVNTTNVTAALTMSWSHDAYTYIRVGKTYSTYTTSDFKISEFHVYNRSLTAAEMTTIYNTGPHQFIRAWQSVGAAPATQSMFNSDGMTDISGFGDSIWRSLSTTNPEILIDTDAGAPPDVTLNGVPIPQVIIPNQSLSLVGQIQTIAASVVTSGAGVVRMVISGDGGVTWKAKSVASNGGNVIPDMTADNAPSPVVISVDAVDAGYSAFMAVDRDTSTMWYTHGINPPDADGHWIKVDFGAGNEKKITLISITPALISSPNYSVKDWKLFASNDNATWTLLTSGTHDNSGNRVEYTFSNSTLYRFYKLAIADSYHATIPTTAIAVAEMELMESKGLVFTDWYNVNVADLNDMKTNGISASNLSLIPQADLSAIVSSNARIAFYLEQATATDKATINFAEIDTTVPTYSPAVNGITVVYDAIDERYYGLLFMDVSQAYYSTSFGDILQYLDFGTLVAGQTSLEVKVTLKNNYNFSVNNLRVFSTSAPANLTVELSKTTSPFISQSTLSYSTILAPDQTIDFYVRLSSTLATKAGGNFNIRVTADSIS